MGTCVDSEQAYSPTRNPATMRRERREAKRRMVLLSLLGCLFFLTVVAFRRSNNFVGDYTYQSTNATATAPKPDTNGRSWLTGKPKSKGPVVSGSGRYLPDSSLAALRNSSLGVSEIRREEERAVTDCDTPLSSKRSSCSTCHHELTSSTP